MKRIAFLFNIAVFLVLSSCVFAQESTATSSNAGVPLDSGLVSMDFQDADIKNVLKVLAYKSGVNIVAGPEVTGLVTIQLKDVPWQKALDVILSTYGYSYERKGNIITVTTIENLKKRREDNQLLQEQEPLTTKTFSLNYSKASEVVDSIGKMKTGRGTVNFDQRTNTIIIQDLESNIDLMSEVIVRLDAITPQVLIEAKVIETTLTNTEKLGIDWTLKGTATGAGRPTTFPFNTADQSNNFLPGAFTAAGTFNYGTLSATALSAVMEILKSRTDTNILSNPRIVTLDNQPAKITVGSQFPIPQYTYNTEQAKLQVSGWEYKDIGIVFEVTPHVNSAGMITLDLHPIITDSSSTVTFESTQLPLISIEEATTKVMVEDGQTLVIAGLIKDKTDSSNKKVPFLGDVPILGQAFKKKEDTKTKTELLIFLTPHIITPSPTKKAAAAE